MDDDYNSSWLGEVLVYILVSLSVDDPFEIGFGKMNLVIKERF